MQFVADRQTRDDDVDTARRVLNSEATALEKVAQSLDGSFTEALDLLARTEGRTIVTGMGKSGHVARKIAATLASTGTPAVYVHPAEASHGDLGMIAPDDVVLALSNSGETSELSDLVGYCRRFEIPLIAMTGRKDSTIGEMADCALVLPALAEACPMGLAPTTSTTAMMALGDALAVALLGRRGFTREDFQVLHPGGRLGQMLLRVDDLMATGDDMPLVMTDASMSETLVVMTAKCKGCVGVIDTGGSLAGIITDGDLRRHMSSDLLKSLARDIMTRSPHTIRSRALAAEALGQMNARRITSLFIVEDGRPTGIIHLHDCLRAGIA
jgi:arabinose-5-phosphate isomerase